MPQYNYYQINGGEETWLPVPVAMFPALTAEKKPKFTTVLAVSALAEDLSREDRDALKYAGPLYFDWDGKNNEAVTEQTIKLLQGLVDKGLDMSAVKLFATGGRGYHCEIPAECFMDKAPKAGIQYLPLIYKEIAFGLAVDLLDLLVYSGGRGRMWRTPNVKRDNEHYKVQITWQELLAMTPELYLSMTSAPRPLFVPNKAVQCLDLTILFDKATQTIKEKIGKRRKKGSTDNSILRKAQPPSITALMEGRGIKEGVGFHQISLQLGIVSDAMGWTEEELLEKTKDLVELHAGDGNRYNTPDKRATELVRMHRYTHENPCYEFSVGALKVLLDHEAPDLDGIPVTKEEVDAGIEQAKTEVKTEESSSDSDAYNDVAGGLTMTKYGVYATQEDGTKKRICAISFDDPEILRDAQSGVVSCYTAIVLINGKPVGRQTMELEMFSGLQAFNRFASRHAHVLQGSDAHVRGLLLRLAQKATMANKIRYVAKREGLDVVSIPGHENELLHRPFLVWSDNKGVQLEPRIAETGVQMSFQGYPDPRGNYRTDLADAPELREWAQTEQKEVFRQGLHAFIGCQRPDVIANFFGWYTACFYRMMFNKIYDKFPLLHVAGNAGGGKTEMNRTMLSMFYYNQDGKELTPQSSIFAIQQNLSSSSSIPLLVDEYKPTDMGPEMHNKLKLLWRDAYNNREIAKGGGSRENEDYRSLSLLQISAPIVFVAESMEEEPATMERVVMVTVVRPPESIAAQWSMNYSKFAAQKQNLSVIGKHVAAEILHTYSLADLRAEFDIMYRDAQFKYMINAQDIESGATSEVLRAKQGAKQRTVFNFTVSAFGLRKFKKVIETVYGTEEFRESFERLEGAIYTRMADLLPATQAEYLKVLSMMASQSYLDPTEPAALLRNVHYSFIDMGGKACIEMSLKACYHRYRTHCRTVSYKPLFNGDATFLHAMRDSAALITQGGGVSKLNTPSGSFVFDATELKKLGVEDFKA